MKTQRRTVTITQDRRSFQLSIAAVYAPLVLMLAIAAVIF